MSLRKAINRACKDCVYDPAAPGTWRQQVENCTVTCCALYPYRPFPIRSKIGLNRAKNTHQMANSDGGKNHEGKPA